MRFAFKNLWRRGVRTALSILGVAVGVGSIVAFTAMGEGFKESLNTYARESGADLVVLEEKAGDPAFGRVKGEEMALLREHPGVKSVSGSSVMPASLPGRRAPFLVMGRDPSEPLIRAYRNPGLRGRLLQQEGEILLGSIAAQELDRELGDELELFRRPFRVVGIFHTGVRWENGAGVIHARELRHELSMDEGSAMVAFVVLDDPEAWQTVALELQAKLPHMRVLPTAFLASNFEQLAYIDSFIWVISLAALLVGAIGILNTMLMSVSERIREIGTLRAFGWSRAKVLRLILSEGVLTSLLGGLAGAGLGYLGAEGLMKLAPQGILEATYGLHIFGRGLVIALGLGLLGALYPAWRASRLAPAEALRYE